MGLIHLYCGDGKGKTTSSIGLSIRAAGSGLKVLYVQFLKNGDSGEFNLIKDIKNITTLHTKQKFPFYFIMTKEEKIEAQKAYTDLLCKAVQLSTSYDMVVLDECISAYNLKMIDKEVFLEFLKSENHPEIILTGRDADNEIIQLCDYVSEIKKLKHPFDKGIKARKGIEY